MNVAWSSTSFGFYLINYYLKYIPGDIFTNIILSSLADCCSSFISAWLGTKLGHLKALIISFIISGVLGLGLVCQETNDADIYGTQNSMRQGSN